MQSGKCKVQIQDVPVALLAGGLATRLGHVAASVPKAMVEVAGRPFIEHQLELLQRNGIRRVVLCLGHLGEQIEDHLGDGGRFDLSLSYRHDGKLALGTGGALRSALDELGEMFWVMYGDSYMDIDYASALASFTEHPAALGLMTVIRNDDRWDRSNVIFRDGRLMRYDKKNRVPDMRHIDYGVQLLRRAAAERLLVNRPADVADLYRVLVSEGKMIGHEVHRRFYEIGTPGSLEETRKFLSGSALQGELFARCAS